MITFRCQTSIIFRTVASSLRRCVFTYVLSHSEMPRLPKGMKPLKNTGEPKRSRSGYFLWCDSIRASNVHDPEIDGKSMAVASKVLALRWRALSPEEKGPFEERAREMKAQFNANKPKKQPRRQVLVSGWRSSRDVVSGAVVYTNILSKQSTWVRPEEKDAVALPPAPRSARRLYEMQNPNGPAWMELSSEQHAPYEATAAADRAEYNTKLVAIKHQ